MIYIKKREAGMSKIFDFLVTDENYRENADFPVPVEQAGNATVYHCKRHDYVYYPETVKNAEGVRYRAGYYDETGKYYKELMVFCGVAEEGITCKYCGHRMQATEIEDMEDLKCPNCDASFELVTPADVVKKDKVVASEVRFTDKSEAEARRYVREAEVIEKTRDRKRAAYDPEYNQDYDEELFYEEQGIDMQAEWITGLLGPEEDREKAFRRFRRLRIPVILFLIYNGIAAPILLLLWLLFGD